MTWFWLLYLGVGLLNAVHAGARGILLLTNYPRRRGGSPAARHVEALLEAVLYVLLWPVQVLYWLVFGVIPNGIEWLHNKIAGERA